MLLCLGGVLIGRRARGLFFARTLILCAFGAICQNFAIDRIFKNFLSCLCCKLKAQGCARDT